MSVYGSVTGTQIAQMNDVENMNDVNLNALENVRVIRLSSINGNISCDGMLQLLQIKGFVGGLTHENSYDHI